MFPDPSYQRIKKGPVCVGTVSREAPAILSEEVPCGALLPAHLVEPRRAVHRRARVRARLGVGADEDARVVFDQPDLGEVACPISTG